MIKVRRVEREIFAPLPTSADLDKAVKEMATGRKAA